MTTIIKNARVTIDGESIFQAAHLDLSTRWNGFVVPYFTKDEALKIMAWMDLEATPESQTMTFDADTETFIVTDPAYVEDEGYEDEIWGFTEIDGERLYAIGGMSWTWSLLETEEATTSDDSAVETDIRHQYPVTLDEGSTYMISHTIDLTQTWNGFLAPYFDRAQMDALVEWLSARGMGADEEIIWSDDLKTFAWLWSEAQEMQGIPSVERDGVTLWQMEGMCFDHAPLTIIAPCADCEWLDLHGMHYCSRDERSACQHSCSDFGCTRESVGA